ncbi:MAG: DUF5677 domain-containing protein [Coriobacteriia bacterium]|nr:DUF5677 domain-containing protein [Coriobacteriia bacterium]
MEQTEARWPLDRRHESLIALVEKTAVAITGDDDVSQAELKNTHEGWIATVFATRCARNLKAVATLCKAGYATEAVPIVRAMLEDAVTVAYIEADPDVRARKYVDFEETRAYFYMKEALKAELVDESSERVKELTQKYGEVEDLDEVWWCGVGPGGMAGKLKGTHKPLRRDFFAMYPLLSDDAHGNAMSARNYTVQDEAGDTVAFVHAPTQYRVDEVAAFAIYCAWRLAEAAAACGFTVAATEIQGLLAEGSAVYRGQP